MSGPRLSRRAARALCAMHLVVDAEASTVSARKKEPVSEAVTYDSAIEQRLAGIEENIAKLYDALFKPTYELPNGVAKKAAIVPSTAETALRARVGRAARNYGMTFDQWVGLHGMRDKKFPKGVDAAKRTLGKRRKGA